MKVLQRTMRWAGAVPALLVMSFVSHAQGGAIPIKPGLWETTINGTTTMTLPAEQEARIAAMPAAQQARIRSMMAGASPTTIKTHGCAATQTNLDTFLNDMQQKKGMKCTFSNRTQTTDGVSFDTNCTSPEGTASGHTEIHMSDSDRVTGTTHLTADTTGRNGGAMHMTISNTITSKYLGADCGSVKPGSAEVVQ